MHYLRIGLLCCICCLCFIRSSVAQDPQVLSRQLVQEITQGTQSETERFEAIYAWVTHHINYGYRTYITYPGLHLYTPADVTLRHKEGICMQYAQLMDQLCALAGITNVTVIGYSPDEFWDKGDSVFFSNHAWNAVRLEGNWYVYDATFKSGELKNTAQLKKTSELLGRWKENAHSKIFRLRKHQHRIRIPANELCGIKKHRLKIAYQDISVSRFWKTIYKILNLFKVRYDSKPSKTQDLFQPEDPVEFAKTHFPEIPFWSLTQRSAVSDSTFNNSNCPECDRYAAIPWEKHPTYAARHILTANPQNHFATSQYLQLQLEQSVYALLMHQTKADSLWRDSLTICLKNARKHLLKSGPQIKAHQTFYKRKEQLKIAHQQAFNAGFLEITVRNATLLKRKVYAVGKLNNSIRNVQRHTLKDYAHLKKYRFLNPKNTDRSEKNTERVDIQIALNESHLDSLNATIDELQGAFSAKLPDITANLKRQFQLLQQQVFMFNDMSHQRIATLQDDWDTVIQNYQLNLGLLQILSSSNLQRQIIEPVNILLLLSDTLFHLMELRNKQHLKILRMYEKAALSGAKNQVDLKSMQTAFTTRMLNDYCFLDAQQPPIYLFQFHYRNFRQTYSILFRVLKTDNYAEKRRHKVVLNEIRKYENHIRSVIKADLRRLKASRN